VVEDATCELGLGLQAAMQAASRMNSFVLMTAGFGDICNLRYKINKLVTNFSNSNTPVHVSAMLSPWRL